MEKIFKEGSNHYISNKHFISIRDTSLCSNCGAEDGDHFMGHCVASEDEVMGSFKKELEENLNKAGIYPKDLIVEPNSTGGADISFTLSDNTTTYEVSHSLEEMDLSIALYRFVDTAIGLNIVSLEELSKILETIKEEEGEK